VINSSPDTHPDRLRFPAGLWQRLSSWHRRAAPEQAAPVQVPENEPAPLRALRPTTPQLLDQLTRARAALRDHNHERFRRACHGYLLTTLKRATSSTAKPLHPSTAARVDWACRYLGEHDLAAAAAIEQASTSTETPTSPDGQTASAAADTFIAPAGGPTAEAHATLQAVLDDLVAEARRLHPEQTEEGIAVVVYSHAAELLDYRGRASLASWLDRRDPQPQESTATIPVDLDEVIAAQPGQQPAPPTAAGPNS
jgi:hypothetical protein